MQSSWVPLPDSSSISSYPFEAELLNAIPWAYSDSPLRIPTPKKHLMHNPLNVYARQEVINVSGTSYSNKLLWFTKDSYATVDQICECPSCGIQIRAGKPCLYIATINPGQSDVKETKSTASSYHTIPDPHIIQQSVNAAQRKSSVNPPPMVAVSDWTNASMGPPPMSHHLHHTSGPNVAIPTSWQGLAVLAAPSRLTGPIGYLSHHGMYATEHQRWAKATYSTPIAIADTISLEISAIHEAGSHNKKIIANICKGEKDIDARIDAPDLMRLALDTVLPKLCAFGDTFAWHDEEFTVQDSTWVDLSTHPPFELYFLLQFMQPVQGAGKAPIFKMKQFTLLMVVPESQWQEFELWQEESQAALATTSSFSTTPQLSVNVISSVPQMSTTVLKIGGGADLNVKQVGKLQNENIHFYSIPT
ncbi:hypothetical protein EDB19DRAFT_1827030 [Suillus lakei]|nr:hypothetical protein EDB19DRAFT_1827030 [Suillus lakei]